MRVPKMMSLGLDTVKALQAKAHQHGVSVSALTELYVTLGLKAVPDTKLQTWAPTSRRGGVPSVEPKARLPQSEQKILTSLRGARAAYPERFVPAENTRLLTGQTEAIFWRALRALEAKGLVELDPQFANAARDTAGNPVESCWRLK